MIRVVDDLLMFAQDHLEAVELRQALGKMMTAAGMALNKTKDKISDLGAGEPIEWLGFNFRKEAGRLQARLTEKAWGRLDEHLAGSHERPNSPTRAVEIIESWLTEAGPTFPNHDRQEVYDTIVGMALSHGFEEIPGEHELESRWEDAWRTSEQIRGKATAPDS